MAKRAQRVAKPIRVRMFREDASIASVERTIATKMGLPAGSVMLVYPNGRKARSDATVESLRRRWNHEG